MVLDLVRQATREVVPVCTSYFIVRVRQTKHQRMPHAKSTQAFTEGELTRTTTQEPS